MDPRREMQLVANGMQSELLADAPAACESEARDIARLRQNADSGSPVWYRDRSGNLPKKAAKARCHQNPCNQVITSHEVTSPADALVE